MLILLLLLAVGATKKRQMPGWAPGSLEEHALAHALGVPQSWAPPVKKACCAGCANGQGCS